MQKSPAQEPEIVLPENVLNKLKDLKNRIQIDVIDPFFKIDDLDSLEANWDHWVEWFAPLCDSLIQELIPYLDISFLQQTLHSALNDGLDDIYSFISKYSKPLANTFALSFKTGIQGDFLLINNLVKISSSGIIPPLGNVPASIIAERSQSSFGFGLSFVLIMGAHEKRNVSHEKMRFLILKHKRMAAWSYMSATRLLNWIQQQD